LLVPAFFRNDDGRGGGGNLRWANAIAVISAMIAYCVGRFLLMKCAGLSSPHTGVNFYLLLSQSDLVHAGVWYALEGGWLIVAMAGWLLWRKRGSLPLAVLIGGVVILLIGSFMVAGVTRSAAYLLPAMLAALAVIAHGTNAEAMRGFYFVAFLIS